MLYRLIFVLWLFAYSCKPVPGKTSQKAALQEQDNKLDPFQEAPIRRSDCFLKLKTNTIRVKYAALSDAFGKVLIRYTIEQSKIKGDVQIARWYVFRKSDRQLIFNSDDESLSTKENLCTAICTEAKRNLKVATLSCEGKDVSSWGQIMMIVNFLPVEK